MPAAKGTPQDRNGHRLVFSSCPNCGRRSWVLKQGKGFCSRSCSKSKENHPLWKGDAAKYVALHQRVWREFGKASACVWGCEGTYEWANMTGRYEDVYDYTSMCVSCHQSYDTARASMDSNTRNVKFSRISNITVRDIRDRVISGEIQRSVAQSIGISQSAVSRIVNCQSRKSVN